MQAKLHRLREQCKQAADAKLDRRKIDRADLQTLIERELDLLAPGERERIRRIAAGELAAPGCESET